MAIYVVNSRADILRQNAAFQANCMAAKGLQRILKSNLGPRGTFKLLVGAGGQLKLTKDGNVLLREMQINHPTAAMIARAATAQDEMCGDGTTSNVIIIGEIIKESEKHILGDGVSPTAISSGIDLARNQAFQYLDDIKICVGDDVDRELLVSVANTALRSKINSNLAINLAEDIVDAVRIVQIPNQPIDLFMVEIVHMKHRLAEETRLIKGMVMDHGCRHPDMPKSSKNCYILTCNVSLEYDKSEVNSGFFYKTAEQKALLVESERRFTDDKVRKIIDLKRLVCNSSNGKNFVVLNQKGIDPPSLDMLAKEGIMALRRVKRRNMERLQLCCGGNAVNSVEELKEEDLGYAEMVYEKALGEDKFTFVEGVRNPKSCCILVKGSSDHVINQVKDAIRDGLRAVRNVIEDKYIIPGAGAFELATYCRLQEFRKGVPGKQKYGIDVFANAMLSIPKMLAENSGLDVQETVLNLVDEYNKCGKPIGLDIYTGHPINPAIEGIYDNYRVKRQTLCIAPALAQQLILVDEIVKAGKSMGSEN